MKKLNILIANMNKEVIEEMNEKLKGYKLLNIISITTSGQETLNNILIYKPDVVILDSILPEIDGIGIVEYLEKSYINLPYIILTTVKITNIMCHLASNRKINLIIERTINYKFLIKKLKDYARRMENKNMKQILLKKYNEENVGLTSKIMFELKNLSIKQTTKGYRFLTEAIRKEIEDTSILKCDIFKYLEEKFGIKRNTIMSDIRNSINYGYKQRPEKFKEIFKTTEKPSNLLFIEMISKNIGGDKIRIF